MKKLLLITLVLLGIAISCNKENTISQSKDQTIDVLRKKHKLVNRFVGTFGSINVSVAPQSSTYPNIIILFKDTLLQQDTVLFTGSNLVSPFKVYVVNYESDSLGTFYYTGSLTVMPTTVFSDGMYTGGCLQYIQSLSQLNPFIYNYGSNVPLQDSTYNLSAQGNNMQFTIKY